jgi:hypothetical protein
LYTRLTAPTVRKQLIAHKGSPLKVKMGNLDRLPQLFFAGTWVIIRFDIGVSPRYGMTLTCQFEHKLNDYGVTPFVASSYTHIQRGGQRGADVSRLARVFSTQAAQA